MNTRQRSAAILIGLALAAPAMGGSAVAAPATSSAAADRSIAASGRPDVRGYTGADLASVATSYSSRGFQMSAVSGFALSDGTLRFNAVWQPASRYRPWVAGWAYSDLVNENNTLQAQGYRMIAIDVTELPGGQDRYNAIWAQGAAFSTYLSTSSLSALQSADNTLIADGYRMSQLSSAVRADGSTVYTALWQKSRTRSTWVTGWTVADFSARDATLRSAGWQLRTVEPRLLPGDQLRVDAVWRKVPAYSTWIVGYTSDDFSTVYAQQQSAGHSLRSLTGFALSGDQVRYNGVWW